MTTIDYIKKCLGLKTHDAILASRMITSDSEFLKELSIALFNTEFFRKAIKGSVSLQVGAILDNLGLRAVHNEIESIKDELKDDMRLKMKEVIHRHQLWAQADAYREELNKHIKDEFMKHMSRSFDTFISDKRI